MGVDYFVIDDGWFRKPGVEGVGVDVGDWEVSKERFDGDMRPTLSAIRKEGLLPGLWFEYENVGRRPTPIPSIPIIFSVSTDICCRHPPALSGISPILGCRIIYT